MKLVGLDNYHKFITGLTFDDVLLKPQYSEVVPTEAETKTVFTKKIKLNIPIVSAAMDTVTESALAISLAQAGGIGVIHKNLSIEQQVAEVEKVKRSESGMVVDPITLEPTQTIAEAVSTMEKNGISGFPVVEKDGKLVGIVTHRDLRFETRMHLPVLQVMTKKLITVPLGTSMEKAKEVLQKHRVEKLLVVDKKHYLKGLITVKDIEKAIMYPQAAKDALGHLRAAAAIGATGDFFERARALVKAGADALVVDTAHGHSKRVIEAVKKIKKSLPGAEVVAGNIGTAEAAAALIKAGADAVKVGIGPGSICTTRIVTGAGMPQITAIMQVAKVCKKTNTPLIADGGIKFSGDITKAIAAGATSVMVGSIFAGTDESPGEIILYQGRSYKGYRGMGSIGAMKRGSKDRYGQDGLSDSSKLVPEGIEGQVPYKGPLMSLVNQLVGGLKAGLGYSGAHNLQELQKKAEFVRISTAGLKESHVHDVNITKEAPNYRLD
ncbi:MAG: IMP dehydrogenase [Candidatus Doudnabacteria bacterium CG10_big_fil_rev_8_21_14_0_10_42_18]|uniref:Inosine-5'-monophosphate dehydrogenase n=1 Tax=Candidatus Doudnabacteria bacterium CG10_big_fil_rev_8_21_14_0_10_42_18 TaxID=1974552 RepID=A0A2H0VBA3_9BACT|nr:MAG: IMP dehydrogenase [Candidatus Doudnabacteria bacterium CG10_big_fil_rev_8_21_14_0_10_42_18]